MNTRIQQLPTEIANQIAAGEVVERPASVVKELLENAADANADHIVVTIGYGGLNQIQVADNGSGIAADDLPLAVMAHATSKITCLNDLFAIASMGFRGEALASIASVSRLRIESRPASQEQAMQLERQGSQWRLLPCARAQGTTIEVTDLFYNAPVRKNFLKSQRSEFLYIEQVVKRFALARPDIALQLHHNSRQILDLPAAAQPASRARRVQKLLGKAFFDNALPVEVQRANMHLTGWISAPAYQRSQQDKQWIYVNQRMVRDKLLNHALKQGYEGQLHPGRHPACVLYLTIDAGEVDVNVHPTKHELRFQQPRLVHDFLMSSLQDDLQAQIPETVENEAADAEKPSAESLTETPDIPSFDDRTASGAVKEHSQPVSAASPVMVAEPVFASRDYYGDINRPVPAAGHNPHEKITSSPLRSTGSGEWREPSRMKNIQWQQIGCQFALIRDAQNIWIARTSSLLQAVLQWQLEQEPLPWPSRPLLLPIPLPASMSARQPDEWQPFLGQLGIDLQQHSSGKYVLKTIPVLLPQLDVKAFLHALMQAKTSDVHQAQQLCCRFAIPESQQLDSEQLDRVAAFLSARQDIGDLPYLRRLDDTLCGELLDE